MYAIVETLEEEEKFVVAVPSLWIIGDEHTLLWPDKKSDQIKGRCKNLVPQSNWKKYKCRKLLDNIQTWKEALEKELYYEEYSNSESEVAYLENKKESRKHPALKLLQTEEYDFNIYKNISDLEEVQDQSICAIENIPILISGVENVDVPTLPTIDLRMTEPISSDALSQSNAQFSFQENKLDEVLQRLKILENGQKDIKKEIELMKTFNARILTTLDILIEKNCNTENKTIDEEATNNEETEPNVDSIFPIKSPQEIDDIEKQLRNDINLKKKVIKKLSHFGGKNSNSTLRNMCCFLFEDKVLEEYSWAGTTNKRSFNANKEIIDTICMAMRKYNASFTNFDAATFFKIYIKHASTRIKRSDKKNNKNDENTQ